MMCTLRAISEIAAIITDLADERKGTLMPFPATASYGELAQPLSQQAPAGYPISEACRTRALMAAFTL